MGRRPKVIDEQAYTPPPARTPAARENQLISLAVDLAEKQLRAGNASAMVISHFLKLATASEKARTANLEREAFLLEAKTDQIRSQKKTEELYQQAMDAFRSYSSIESDDYD